MLTIRPWGAADYAAMAEIRSSFSPFPISEEEFREQDRQLAADPTNLHIRFVAEEPDGRVVGYSGTTRETFMPPGQFYISTAVPPDQRGKGVGRALAEATEAWARGQGAQHLVSYIRGQDDYSLGWAQRRGYVVDRERTEAVLDLTAFDPSRFAGQVERVTNGGLRLLEFDRQVPESLLPALYAWSRATEPDVPDWEGDDFPSYEKWVRWFSSVPNPRWIALALDGERVVGGSIAVFPMKPGHTEAYTEYTGVLREYRGRGIAMAVKLLTIDETIRRGFTSMRTNNDPDNPPMLAVNQRLGYVTAPGPRRVKKQLGP